MATVPSQSTQAAVDPEMLNAVFRAVSMLLEIGKRYVEVDTRHAELNNVVLEVDSDMGDMKQEARNQEAQPGKKRKKVVDVHFNQAERYIRSAQSVLDNCQAEQWKVMRMSWVPSIERHHREGKELLTKGSQLREEGLTYNEVRKRGEMLPLDEDQYMPNTFSALMDSAFQAMKDGTAKCIGIYGTAGAGKTNIMKQLHNKVFKDEEKFKAVFWATAPEPDPDHSSYNKALQQCVADGMWVDLDNDVLHDVVRCAGRIMARLQEIGSGRAVLFLDNVKEDFQAYDLLGIPSLMTPESTNVNCILVFSTLTRDICNRMRCDLPLKMELLEKEEAKNLFLHEVKRGNSNDQWLSTREQRIKELAIQVADQCANMPLAIIIIARSMVGIKDLREWNNRLNEMMGTIGSIHDEYNKILEQLKFGYICLKDRTVQRCFLAAATLLGDDQELSEHEIIEEWKNRGLIGIDRPSDPATDQGHAILNQLERACLLQVAPDHLTVSMNKWIWKMAMTEVS